MTRIAALALGAVAAVSAEDALHSDFIAWIKEHQKSYAIEDFETRFAVWKANHAFVQQHNNAQKSYFLRMNQFADLTNDEFRDMYTGRQIAKPEKTFTGKFEAPLTSNIVDSVDWRNNGAVTPVKDQGPCGSCWSFSTVGSMEGANAVHNGQLLNLSEQELVDCDTRRNAGCNGGLEIWAYEDYIRPSKGLCLEADYPGGYVAKDGSCKANDCPTRNVPITGHVEVPSGEAHLQDAIVQQPVAVGVDAAGRMWQLYGGGIAADKCGTQIDHGVTAVGFGMEANGDEYWIIKNSWGASWGENGYIRLAKASNGKTYNGKSGQCGVAAEAVYPTL